jgi:glycosyltransferase involved in cell wall biosynthesis
MHVVHIIPGSGGSFYCGNCLRDSTIVDSLRQTGIEVTKIPMYLPLFSDEHDLADVPVFYGAISIYLKQLYPVFRKAPIWVDKMFNSGPALKLAAKMSGSTSAKGLEDMTVSMLLGEEGKQKQELDHLVDWMAEHGKPDVVHLSNALLLGLARRIKEKLNTIVVCSLQDEDQWIDAMDEDFQKKTWDLMRKRGKDIDAFFAVSDFYAKRMRLQMDIPSEKLHTIHIGIDAEKYAYRNSSDKEPAIGYISRMSKENGFEVMIEAFIRLKKKPGMENVKLIATGGSTGDDHAFLHMIKRKIRKSGLQKHIIFHKDFEGEGRHDFFRKVSVISVPVLKGEAFGLYLLEAMASGIPVVQPQLGAFPEIINLSEGGLTFEPNEPDVLAQQLVDLLGNDDQLRQLSQKARKGVEQHFDIQTQASKMVKVYNQIAKQKYKNPHAAKD